MTNQSTVMRFDYVTIPDDVASLLAAIKCCICLSIAMLPVRSHTACSAVMCSGCHADWLRASSTPLCCPVCRADVETLSKVVVPDPVLVALTRHPRITARCAQCNATGTLDVLLENHKNACPATRIERLDRLGAAHRRAGVAAGGGHRCECSDPSNCEWAVLAEALLDRDSGDPTTHAAAVRSVTDHIRRIAPNDKALEPAIHKMLVRRKTSRAIVEAWLDARSTAPTTHALDMLLEIASIVATQYGDHTALHRGFNLHTRLLDWTMRLLADVDFFAALAPASPGRTLCHCVIGPAATLEQLLVRMPVDRHPDWICVLGHIIGDETVQDTLSQKWCQGAEPHDGTCNAVVESLVLAQPAAVDALRAVAQSTFDTPLQALSDAAVRRLVREGLSETATPTRMVRGNDTYHDWRDVWLPVRWTQLSDAAAGGSTDALDALLTSELGFVETTHLARVRQKQIAYAACMLAHPRSVAAHPDVGRASLRHTLPLIPEVAALMEVPAAANAEKLLTLIAYNGDGMPHMLETNANIDEEFCQWVWLSYLILWMRVCVGAGAMHNGTTTTTGGSPLRWTDLRAPLPAVFFRYDDEDGDDIRSECNKFGADSHEDAWVGGSLLAACFAEDSHWELPCGQTLTDAERAAVDRWRLAAAQWVLWRAAVMMLEYDEEPDAHGGLVRVIGPRLVDIEELTEYVLDHEADWDRSPDARVWMNTVLFHAHQRLSSHTQTDDDDDNVDYRPLIRRVESARHRLVEPGRFRLQKRRRQTTETTTTV